MYTVVRLYKIKSGTFEEISQKAQEGFVSIVSSTPGFVGYYLVNTGNNNLMTISIIESQVGAYESTAAAAKWVKANLAEHVETPPTVIAGEASIHQTS